MAAIGDAWGNGVGDVDDDVGAKDLQLLIDSDSIDESTPSNVRTPIDDGKSFAPTWVIGHTAHAWSSSNDDVRMAAVRPL